MLTPLSNLGAPVDDTTDEQDGGPGDELRRLARQFGAPATPSPSGPGDELRRLASQYGTPGATASTVHAPPALRTPLAPADVTAAVPLSPLHRPETQPGAVVRGIEQAGGFVSQAIRHPLNTAASVAKGIAEPFVNIATVPTEQELDAARSGTDAAATGFAGKLGINLEHPYSAAIARQLGVSQNRTELAQRGAQAAATAIAGPLEAAVEQRAAANGATALASKLVGRSVAGATAMSAFSPDDPVAGAIGGVLLSLAPEASAAAAQRAAAAGLHGVAKVMELSHQLTADAGAQGTAEGRALATEAVTKALAGLSPDDLAHIRNDPVLGPLSREAMQRAGIATAEHPNVGALKGLLQEAPPDEPLAQALRPNAAPAAPSPVAEPAPPAPPVASQPPHARPGPTEQSLTEESIRQRARALGYDENEAVQLYRDDLAGKVAHPAAPPFPQLQPKSPESVPHSASDELSRLAEQYSAPSTEPHPVNGTSVPVTPGYSAEQIRANQDEAAAERAAVPMDAQRLIDHAEAKGNGLTPEGIDRSAAALRDAGYSVTDDMVRAAKAQASRIARIEPAPGTLPERDEFGNLRESFDDQRNRMIAETTPQPPLAPAEELRRLAQEHGASTAEPAPAAPLSRLVPEQTWTPRPEIASVPGRATRVLLRDGQTLPAQYRIVSAEDVQSSHDPFSFTPNPNYPEGVQGRDYQRNKASQLAVQQRALDFNPDIALNPSESANEGVPTILPDGTVLAGNERSMLPRRAAVQAPERYAGYVEQLKQRAQAFGIDPATVDATPNPVLVRVLTDPADVAGGPSRWAEINRLSDEVSTKAKSATEEGTARAAKLSQASDALDHLGTTLQPEQTVNEYLGTPDGRTFVRKLMADGVLTTDEFSRLSDGSGTLTEDGRLAVRRMLLSTAVTDPAAVLDAPASAVNKIEQAVPAIVATKGTKFDASRATTAALKLLAEARDNGVTVRDMADQGALFGEVQRPAVVTALASFLEQAKPTHVKAAFRRYAALAREALDNGASTDMFGGTGFEKPIDAFNEAFGFARNEPIPEAAEGKLYSVARMRGEPQSRTTTAASEATAKLFGEIPPEQRRDPSHPTEAASLLAEARANPREAGPGKALGGEPAPETPDMAVRHVNRYVDAFRKIFAPTHRGPEAEATGYTVREHDAALVQRYEQAVDALKGFGRSFDRTPVAEQLDFIDRMETGREQRTPALTQAAATIRQLLDTARNDIIALGNGTLEHWIENYFPHIWADPERARSVIASMMGQRSLTGKGSFLKHRTIPTVREGIEAGLVPVTFNPVDLTLYKLREMHRYLAGQRVLAELKEQGSLKFVSSFAKAPSGMEQIKDKVSTVYGPPRVTVVEAYDHFIKQGLEDVLSELGVEHTRRPNIGGGRGGGVRLGYAEGDRKITTRSATDLSVLEHELGHTLDARFQLWDRLHQYEPEAGQRGTKKAATAFRVAIDNELRAIADLRNEGIENVEPATQNYVRKREEKVANAVMGILHAPDRMREVAPTVDARLRAILASDPTTAKLLDIRPSFRHAADTFDVKTEGQVVLGHWYAPEPVARVVNNYLSPGMSATALGPFFDVYRSAGNVLNMAQLGLSAFHLGFTSLDAAVSRNALGLLELREGNVGRAAAAFATSPLAPITNALKGRRLKAAYLRGTDDPVLGQIVDGLVAAGGRIKMDEFYGGSAWRQMRLALHEGRYDTAAAKLLPATLQKSSAWLMEHVVPAQKLGVFYDLAQHELAKLPPGADRMEVRAVMARAWDSVENRMGQLTYNNLFWDRAVKDLAMASVRSVGWNLGTARELGGGSYDLARHPGTLTPRSSYVIALPITVGLLGAVVNYIYTGQGPQSLKDYFYPRTGRMNPDGTEERVQLPSYLRDVRDYATAPYRTVKNKINPALALMADMLENHDFYGNQIRNSDDPLVRQMVQEAEYIGKQFEPFGIRNTRTQLARGQSIGTAAENFVGITPAPREVVRTPALQRMAEFLSQRGGGSATPEQVEQRNTLRGLRTTLRNAPPSDTTDTGPAATALRALADQVNGGAVSSRQAKGVVRSSQVPPTTLQFQRLTAQEAVEVYKLATPAEKREWLPVFIGKLRNADKAGKRLTVPPSLVP